MSRWLRCSPNCPVVPVLLLGAAACTFNGGTAAPSGLADDGAPITNDANTTPDAPPADADLTPDAMPDATNFVLVDNGLVVRYFMDEASTGQAPTDLFDSTAGPLNLPITYGQAAYTENAGNRGLHWPTALGDGKIEVGMSAAKLAPIIDVTTTTLEIVVDVDGAHPTTICHIAGLRGTNPDFILSARGDDELLFHRPDNALTARWAGADDRQRMVIHVVYDSNLADAERRVDLYKNGVLVPKTTSTPPPMGTGVPISTGSEFMIGNNQNENQSIAGTIYYVAYYDRALTPSEVTNNAQRLQANDDE